MNEEGRAKMGGKEMRGLENEDEDVDFLGRLFWYTIGETLAPQEELRDFVYDEGIVDDLVPQTPSKKVAWRRATRDMERKIIISGEEEETPEHLTQFVEESEELEMDEVKHDEETEYIAEYMVRKLDKDTKHLVREVRRPDEGRLDYTELIEWQYVNDDDHVAWKPLNPEESHRDLAKMHKEMSERMQTYEESASEYEIRKRVNFLLSKQSRITLKSAGGVYFIPEENHEVIEDVKKLLDKINEWSTTSGFMSELWQVPVISNENQKDLIENGIREETVKFADKRMKEIKEILENNEEITQKKYNNLIDELKDIEERKQEYEDIIDRNLETCEEQVNIMKQQVRKLADNVKGESVQLSEFEED